MAVKIPNPAERLRPPGFHRLIFRDQKPPFLQIIPLNRPVIAVVAHRILRREDSISELVNMHRNEPRDRALQHRRLPQPESNGQLRVEDVDHLSIAVIDAGKLAPYTLQRSGLRGVKFVISDAREGSRAGVGSFG